MSAEICRDVFYFVAPHTWTGDGPVAEVTHHPRWFVSWTSPVIHVNLTFYFLGKLFIDAISIRTK
jgi:hypothetical protein